MQTTRNIIIHVKSKHNNSHKNIDDTLKKEKQKENSSSRLTLFMNKEKNIYLKATIFHLEN